MSMQSKCQQFALRYLSSIPHFTSKQFSKHFLAKCFEPRWLAECAEFASFVIELVIGNYYPLQTTITFKHYKLQRLYMWYGRQIA